MSIEMVDKKASERREKRREEDGGMVAKGGGPNVGVTIYICPWNLSR